MGHSWRPAQEFPHSGDSWTPDAPLRIGLDLQEHRDIRTSLTRYGQRYLDAVLGPEERMQAPQQGLARWVAGRFAAKEAVYKALDAGPEDSFSWARIEVLGHPGRRPQARLHGPAAALARAGGVAHLDLSITHTSDLSAATAVAIRKPGSSALPERSGTTANELLHQELHERIAMSDRQNIEAQVREVLESQGHLKQPVAELGTEDNLYTAGMTSHASVNVMLGLEDELDLEFPEEKLNKQTFSTIQSITETLVELLDD